MRALLGILLCILLLQTQVFAINGGPDYNRGKTGTLTTITGTYGGVMTESSSSGDSGLVGISSTTAQGASSGSIAVYSLQIPATGTSTGTILIFTEGNVYPGTITGIGDTTSGSATFKGLVEAQFNYNYELPQTVTTTSSTGVTTSTTSYVTKTATVVSNGTVDTAIEIVKSGLTSNVLMTGTATLLVGAFLNPTKTVVYSVYGYRQAAA